MGKDTNLSARCDTTRKERYVRTAERLGFSDLSEFLLQSLDSVSGVVDTEGWECRLVHVAGNQVLAIGDDGVDEEVPLPVTAYPIVAPAAFWRALENALQPS
jgi:hypothetical protein